MIWASAIARYSGSWMQNAARHVHVKEQTLNSKPAVNESAAGRAAA